MKKTLLTILMILIPLIAHADWFPGKGISTVQTANGSTVCSGVTQAIVTNGTLSCAPGVATITTGGGSGGTPAGSTGQFQYNNAGVFAAGSMLATDGTNVGIGTSSPTQALDVNGIAKAHSFLVNGSGAGTIFSPNGIQIDPNNSTGSNLSPVFTIQTGGNVGIGTSGIPSSPLEVTGNTFLNNINANALTYNLNGANFGAWYNLSTDSTLFYGATTAQNTKPSVPIFTLGTDSGNVGINTLTPGKTLDVQGTIRTTGFQLPTSATAGYVLTSSSVGIGTWQPASAGLSGLTTNNVPKATSSSAIAPGDITDLSGNIGIGSTAPGQILDVQGTVRSIALTTTGSGLTNFAGGNVGIGSTAPGQLLDVQGSVRILNGGLVVGNGNPGVTNTAATTCGCKVYSYGVCTQLGTCS